MPNWGMGRWFAFALLLCAMVTHAQVHRPPSVPLVTHDPYFSVWSPHDRLTDGPTTHWTGRTHALTSLVRVDGVAYRLLGDLPASVPAMEQTGLTVTPTRTVAHFRNAQLELTLTFTSPLLPHDLDVFSRPCTYVAWSARSVDGQRHQVDVFFAASGQLAANSPNQPLSASLARGGLVGRVGTVEQPILEKSGDDLCIDWGYLSLFVPGQVVSGDTATMAQRFVSGEQLAATVVKDLSLAGVMTLGRVRSRPVERFAVIGYDDPTPMEYFGTRLRPYWMKRFRSFADVLEAAVGDFPQVKRACERFDRELTADLEKSGGTDYAYLCALAYRQSLAAQKLVLDPKGQPLLFSKENFSNGCTGTVDVIYPAAPLLLLLSPTLAKASLAPVLAYASSSRWPFPFAPHDLGTYPKANGQVYGGGERNEVDQMPVEETGNMLILLAAVAKVEGDARFASLYWPLVRRWAKYLAEKGYDPDRQLCTDDFAGHLAHNVNLSTKAIIGLRSYAELCRLKGLKKEASQFKRLSQSFAKRWLAQATEGDHTLLAFDRKGTWSQKYNLVWDKVLGFKLFGADVWAREVAAYKARLKPFGLPLDSRRDYTKLDWIVWSASLADSRADFEALVKPTVTFLDQSPDRVPMTDWYETVTAKKAGFQARSVVGGVFIQALTSSRLWSKYARRDQCQVGPWAKVPAKPVVHELVPTARTAAVDWSYTMAQPPSGWEKPEFDARSWAVGRGGFGTEGTPGAVIGTRWDSADIWLRRTFTLEDPRRDLALIAHHDEDAEVYLNGHLAARLRSYVTSYQAFQLPNEFLRKGENVLAVHCHQTGGGQFIDVGIGWLEARFHRSRSEPESFAVSFPLIDLTFLD